MWHALDWGSQRDGQKWAIYRAGWPRAVKRAASVYRTAEKCRIAGTQALREFLANIAKRKKKKNDG